MMVRLYVHFWDDARTPTCHKLNKFSYWTNAKCTKRYGELEIQSATHIKGSSLVSGWFWSLWKWRITAFDVPNFQLVYPVSFLRPHNLLRSCTNSNYQNKSVTFWKEDWTRTLEIIFSHEPRSIQNSTDCSSAPPAETSYSRVSNSEAHFIIQLLQLFFYDIAIQLFCLPDDNRRRQLSKVVEKVVKS